MSSVSRTEPDALDLLEVLLRPGAERERCCELLEGPVDDATAIRTSIAAGGIRARDRASIDALVRLAAVTRALDACCEGRIEVAELRTGLHAHARASSWFEPLGSARALVRTVAELLDQPALDERRLVGQLRVLRSQLVDSFAAQVVGGDGSFDAIEPATLAQDELERLDELAATWGAHDALTLARASWARGWVTVPVAGDLLGEADSELDALGAALEAAGATNLLRTTLAPRIRYQVAGRQLRIVPPTRTSSSYPPTSEGLRAATGGSRRRCMFSSPGEEFLVVEREEHRVVAGSPELVALVTGMPLEQSFAEFREHVEQLAIEDTDPPDALLEAARRFGYGRRRGAAIHRAHPGRD